MLVSARYDSLIMRFLCSNSKKKIISIDLSFLKIYIGKTMRNFESRESECVSIREKRTVAYLSTDPCG